MRKYIWILVGIMMLCLTACGGKVKDSELAQKVEQTQESIVEQQESADEAVDEMGTEELAESEAPETVEDAVDEEPKSVPVEPVYLNELAYVGNIGKVWYKFDGELDFAVHTRQEVIDSREAGIELSDDTETPGWIPGVVEDNMGNMYTYGIHIDGRGSRTYMMSFDLNGQYTTFSGVCACPAERCVVNARAYNPEKNLTKYVEIYGDGVLLFTSDTMRYDAAPQAFEIDVTDVQKLIISYPPTSGPNEIATIYDGMLS